jgi:hypothetical protein
MWQMQRYLFTVDAETAKAAAGGMGRFSPLVFSAGGLVEKGTIGRMMEWKEAVSDGAWEYMLRRMALGLLRSRAKMWEVGG